MHYISQIVLDPKNANTLAAIRNPYLFHGAVENAVNVPGLEKSGRILWRRDGDRILVVSETKPDLSHMETQFHGIGMTKEYLLPEDVKEGDRFFFRLLANPCRTCNITDKKTGKPKRIRAAARTDASQMSWLMDKAEHNGFAVKNHEVILVRSFWESLIRHHDDPPVQFQVAQYEGYLTVTDADLFRKALYQGLGKEKAFGCGLLSIIRGESHV